MSDKTDRSEDRSGERSEQARDGKQDMRARFRRILDPEIKLRRRMLQLLSTIALLEFIIVTIYTAVTGSGMGHVLLMLAGTILFAVNIAFTFRTDRMRLGATIAGLLYFALYPLTFLQSGGMYGGAPVVFTFAIIYVYLVTQKWERVASIAVCVITTAVLYATAYLHPELLDRHTVLAEHIESFLAIMLVVLLICLLFKYITQVYITENRIVQRQKKELEDIYSERNRFFSSMSHEIRTPVNAIIGLNEMNMREDIPEEVRENSRNIEAASKILLQSINEILDMSRLETGTMEIMPADYRTTAMLSDIVGMTWLRAKENGLELRFDIDPEIPSWLRGDEVRIKQILLNIVTNAIKYTPEGSVTLKMTGRPAGSSEPGPSDKAQPADQSASMLADDPYIMVYEISDTGIGIKEENIPYLFSSFQRVDEAQTHAIEGTGLGLSIVKQLLDLMDGTVTVTSKYGKGSVFHIEIPQTVVDATPVGDVDVMHMGEQRSGEAGSGRPAGEKTVEPAEGRFTAPDMKVLAVDDTPMNLMVIKKMLRDTQVQLDTAKSGAEALALTAEKHYDVILMDHQMPEMDGIECFKRIRSQEGGKCLDSRVICLTANVGAEMKKLYMESGFDGYLEKPVRSAVLEKTLADILLLIRA